MHPHTYTQRETGTYPCTAGIATALTLGTVRALEGDDLLILLDPLELVHAHVDNETTDHLADELEELARNALARGEDGDLNVGADEKHGRTEHGHGPGLPGTPRHDDQGLLLELLDPKLGEDALAVVFPLILVQLGQAGLGGDSVRDREMDSSSLTLMYVSWSSRCSLDRMMGRPRSSLKPCSSRCLSRSTFLSPLRPRAPVALGCLATSWREKRRLSLLCFLAITS